MQIINSDFSELKFNSPKEDLRKLLCQKMEMDAKVLYTLNNLPKSHIRELFVEKDPDPTLWTVFSEIYVNRIKDFIQGTSGQTVKVIDKKESGFAPGRAVSGETMRSRTNNTLKSKWTKFWELIYEEDKKTENLDQGQQDSSFSLPDLLKSRKTQELKDLEKKAKIKKLSYFSFESIFNSWITSPKKEFDAVLWISKDFESHVWTFSTLCNWVVAATKLDKYGIVVSQLPTLLTVMMDALEVLEKIDTEQTQAKKIKSTHISSLIDVIKTGVYNIRIALGDEAPRIVRELSGSASRFEKFVLYSE